ncbi:hypothetical protein [Neptunomonas phycophila]|jgi:hypothetical protein|uniref:hypothetical protein n=1 Tax=Neptunomonas phycophila TaxID=1572645 RepID=UPI000948CA44|nr:hypothetical protein [Neptunomonas phycophila]QLE96368.1 hypothetical protein FLM49_01420 [Neptunomonas phycophila]
MRSRFRWLIWLILPVLAVAGVQGFYWFQVKRSVDNLISSISPIAQVSYQQISAWAFQDVSLTGMRVRLNSGKPLLSAEQLSIGATNWLDLLSLDNALSSGVVSSSFFVSLDQLQLSSESFSLLKHQHVDNKDTPSLSTLLCPEETAFGRTPLEELGYKNIRGSATFLFDPSLQNNALRLVLKADFNQLAAGEIDLLVGQPGRVSLRREQLAASVIQQMRVSIKDQGINTRWRNRCAEQAGVEVANYSALYQDALNAWWALYGVNVSEDVLQSMVSLWQPNMSTQVRFEPAVPPSLSALTAIEGVEGVFSRAEVRWSVGAKLIEFTDAEWEVILQLYAGDVRSAARAMVTPDAIIEEPAGISEARLREIVPGVMPIRPPEKEKRFELTPFPELEGYIGSSIKVQTLFGREMDGVLVGVNSSGISIRRHIQQGKATIPVLRENISAVEVYR